MFIKYKCIKQYWVVCLHMNYGLLKIMPENGRQEGKPCSKTKVWQKYQEQREKADAVSLGSLAESIILLMLFLGN